MASLVLAACGGSGNNNSSQPSPTARPPHLEVNAGPAPWPAPDDAMARVAAAGLPGFKAEQLFFHVHAHLDLFVDGVPVPVPAGIGIGNEPQIRRGVYQGAPFVAAPNPACSVPCISPLHTHFDDGVLHVENDKQRQISLGQFFTEWGVRFSPDCVGGYCAPDKPHQVYVDGQPFKGDTSTIVLEDKEEIVLAIGTPPGRIPSKFPGT